jgi:hypothetical protein
MDRSERLAEKYLTGVGLGAVVFEPDGNIPPDFVVDGRIGVEVRRLNQNYTDGSGQPEGLEEVSIPLVQRLKRLLPTLGPSVHGESWYVCIDYSRPIGNWRLLESRIRQGLLAFMRQPLRERTDIPVAPNVTLDLLLAGRDYGSFFVLGASGDNDSGGFVLAELEKNLRLCISEKERKIAPYRGKYPEWWLVLSDHIDFALDVEDREYFRSHIMRNVPHSFARIVLLDPRDNGRAFEV